MLIGCITGPDFETAKTQIAKANAVCDGVELREDLLGEDIATLQPLVSGVVFHTKEDATQTSDGKTISVYHNFDETPEDLGAVLEKMPKADIYKIATMANQTTDALRMLTFVKRHENVAGMCMGPLGEVSRILSPVVGSPFTFAAIGKQAAPGQLQASTLAQTYHFHKLSKTTQIYALIGDPVSQSPSHLTHNAFFRERGVDAVYVKLQLKEEELPQFFSLAKELDIRGVSVTAPFKEKLFPFIDVIEDREVGAINTLTFDDLVYGGNTDGMGALDAVDKRIKVKGERLIILGAGGAGKAIAHEAQKRGALVRILSRRYGNLNQLGEYDILINATSSGSPIDLNQLLPRKVVMDIAHIETPFMVRAKALGCQLIYGKEMFEKQAHLQFLRWGHAYTSCFLN